MALIASWERSSRSRLRGGRGTRGLPSCMNACQLLPLSAAHITEAKLGLEVGEAIRLRRKGIGVTLGGEWIGEEDRYRGWRGRQACIIEMRAELRERGRGEETTASSIRHWRIGMDKHKRISGERGMGISRRGRIGLSEENR